MIRQRKPLLKLNSCMRNHSCPDLTPTQVGQYVKSESIHWHWTKFNCGSYTRFTASCCYTFWPPTACFRDQSPHSALETADLCLVLDICALWLECREFQRPLLCLSCPHANKWSRRLVEQTKAHRCSHCRAGRQNVWNVRGEKINPSHFCLSVALSVHAITSSLPSAVSTTSFLMLGSDFRLL